VTKTAGLNRVIWDVQHSSGLGAPPGVYQARLSVAAAAAQTQPFTVLIDPRLAAEGVTTADLQEQFDHNMRMRDLVIAANALAARVRGAQNDLKKDSATSGVAAKAVDAIAAKLFPDPPGVRYAKPGLQEHITYLAGMTRGVDQKIGRDAIERYQVLKRELDDLRAQADRVLGAAK
jgi:hypothetical protein